MPDSIGVTSDGAMPTRRRFMKTAAASVGLALVTTSKDARAETVEQSAFGGEFTLSQATSAITPFRVKVPEGDIAEQMWPNIIYWNEVDKGGHFAAFKQPRIFTDELCRRDGPAGRRPNHLYRLWTGRALTDSGDYRLLGDQSCCRGLFTRRARDLGPRKITVNVVQAGMMETDMAAASKGTFPAESVATLTALHAIPRIATVEETAPAVLFLAGPDAGYITGSVIDVNGGVLA